MFPSFLSGIKNNTQAMKEAILTDNCVFRQFAGIKNNTRAVKDSSDIRNVVHFASTLVASNNEH